MYHENVKKNLVTIRSTGQLCVLLFALCCARGIISFELKFNFEPNVEPNFEQHFEQHFEPNFVYISAKVWPQVVHILHK